MGKPKLNYVGYWSDRGYVVPDGCGIEIDSEEAEMLGDLSHKIISGDVLWALLSRFRTMQLLVNIIDDSGRPILVGDLFGKPKMERMLELGCDYGHAWTCYRPYFEEVYGVEIGDNAITGGDRGNNIFHGDMAHTPFPDNYFDVVVSLHVLEHGVDVDETLDEIYRVTKPNGWSAHILPCLTNNVPEGVTDMHKTCLGYLDWIQKFGEHGFVVVRHYFGWATNQEDWSIIVRKGTG